MVSRPAVINAAQKNEKVTVSCNSFFIISEKITCRNTSATPLNNIKQKRLPNIKIGSRLRQDQHYPNPNGGTMLKFIENIDSKFTVRKKGFIALGAVIIAALLTAAGIAYPMEVFSLLVDSTAGSYVALTLISVILSCAFSWLFSLATRQNISAILTLISNTVFQIGMFFLFAAFRYSMPYLWIITAAVHTLVTVLLFLISKPNPPSNVKRVKEKPPVSTKVKVITAVIYALASDALYITLAVVWLKLLINA